MNTLSKSAIDQLGETLKQAPVSRESLIALDQYRLTFHTAIAQVRRALNEQCGVQCTLRPSKSTPSIIAKLIRQPSTRLTQIQDIAGLRVIVKDYAEQDALRDKVKALYPDCKIYDRREKPSFGYRAVHLVMKLDARLVELQIRTEFQHAWAQVSEKFSDVFGTHHKYQPSNNEFLLLNLGLSESVHEVEVRAQSINHTLNTFSVLPEKLSLMIENMNAERQKSLSNSLKVMGTSIHYLSDLDTKTK